MELVHIFIYWTDEAIKKLNKPPCDVEEKDKNPCDFTGKHWENRENSWRNVEMLRALKLTLVYVANRYHLCRLQCQLFYLTYGWYRPLVLHHRLPFHSHKHHECRKHHQHVWVKFSARSTITIGTITINSASITMGCLFFVKAWKECAKMGRFAEENLARARYLYTRIDRKIN